MVHVNDPTRLVYTWEEYHFGIVNGKYQVYNWAHRSDSFNAYMDKYQVYNLAHRSDSFIAYVEVEA